ncbi:hypothetical protein N7527_004798 [Penicillium freii]|nr:hypothetical protein N7527_004798 [Penicillium freii]
MCILQHLSRVGAAGVSDDIRNFGRGAAHQQFLDDVKDQLQLIFTNLKPNSLSTFESMAAWDVSRWEFSIREAISADINSASPVSHSSPMDGLFEDDRDISPVWIANLSTIVDLGRVTALALCARPSAAFSGPERIHRDVQREIITFLHETRKLYSQDPRSRRGLVDEDISSDNNDYDRIPSAYYDRSPLECMDFQEAVLESSAAIAEAEDFVSFAEWAFGSGGLPALQVLAFGDFSHGDRYRGQQFLMRRACPAWNSDGKGPAGLTCDDTTRLPFRPADMADPSIWDGVSVDGAWFLSACPGGGLMESPYEP